MPYRTPSPPARRSPPRVSLAARLVVVGLFGLLFLGFLTLGALKSRRRRLSCLDSCRREHSLCMAGAGADAGPAARSLRQFTCEEGARFCVRELCSRALR